MAYADSWADTGQIAVISGQDHSVCVSETGTYIYATRIINDASEGIYRSSDKGLTWEKLSGIDYAYNVLCSKNGDVVYALPNFDTDFMRKSTDYGDTWSAVIPGTALTASSAHCCSHDGSVVYISVTAFPNNGLWRSTDSGTTWTSPLTTPFSEAGSICCSGDGSVIYVTRFWTLYKSDDYGATWETSSFAYGVNWVCCSEDGQTIYVNVDNGDANDGVHKSVDGGATFTQVLATSDYIYGQVECSYTGQYAVVTANDDSKQIAVTSDYGANWTFVATADRWLLPAISGDGMVVLALKHTGTNNDDIYLTINQPYQLCRPKFFTYLILD